MQYLNMWLNCFQSDLLFKSFVYLCYVCGCLFFFAACMSVDYMHTWYRGSQKRVFHPLGLKLYMLIKQRGGAGNWILGFLKGQQVVLSADQCLQSNTWLLNGECIYVFLLTISLNLQKISFNFCNLTNCNQLTAFQ